MHKIHLNHVFSRIFVTEVTELFDENTRKCSNVAGKMGKLKLNPVLIEYVKSLAFQFYPLEL